MQLLLCIDILRDRRCTISVARHWRQTRNIACLEDWGSTPEAALHRPCLLGWRNTWSWRTPWAERCTRTSVAASHPTRQPCCNVWARMPRPSSARPMFSFAALPQPWAPLQSCCSGPSVARRQQRAMRGMAAARQVFECRAACVGF